MKAGGEFVLYHIKKCFCFFAFSRFGNLLAICYLQRVNFLFEKLPRESKRKKIILLVFSKKLCTFAPYFFKQKIKQRQ